MVKYMLDSIRLPTVENYLRDFEVRLDGTMKDPFRDQNPPPVLYHYTSWDGLRGILTSQTIRATDHHDLDDAQELRAAENLVDGVVAELSSQVSEQSAQILRAFHAHYAGRRVADWITLYLTCFTSVRDNAYHWKMYAKNDGACLACRNLSDEVPPDEYLGVKIFRGSGRVVYDPQIAEARIRESFLNVLSEYERFAGVLSPAAEGARTKTIVQLAIIAATVGITSKTIDYLNDAEWRATAAFTERAVDPEVNVRGQRFLPLPCRSGGRRIVLEEVIVCGPDSTKAQTQAQEILREAGYQGTDLPPIRLSEHAPQQKSDESARRWSRPAGA
jgi:hypothetical protein